jgi:hypothetical protein
MSLWFYRTGLAYQRIILHIGNWWTIGKKLPQDAINPAHGSLLRVNSPSHFIFSIIRVKNRRKSNRTGFWTSFHSLSSPTLGISQREGFYLPDPCELNFANTILLSNAAISLGNAFISLEISLLPKMCLIC